MIVSYPFDTTALDRNPGLGTPNNQKNAALAFTLGDARFQVEPNAVPSNNFEVPSKVLRVPSAIGSGLVPTNTGRGPHQDYLFLQDSVEYTYTIRTIVGGGVVEKQMPVGAVVGQEGRMILYKGAASFADVGNGNWSQRLIRPFLITAADLATRDAGWPASGSVPTINTASKSVVDNGGDGYNHI